MDKCLTLYNYLRPSSSLLIMTCKAANLLIITLSGRALLLLDLCRVAPTRPSHRIALKSPPYIFGGTAHSTFISPSHESIGHNTTHITLPGVPQAHPDDPLLCVKTCETRFNLPTKAFPYKKSTQMVPVAVRMVSHSTRHRLIRPM